MFLELFTSDQNIIADRRRGYRKAMSLRGGIYADVAIRTKMFRIYGNLVQNGGFMNTDCHVATLLA
ncbi:MAG: hypothetical protein IJ453_03530, partial [Oscillospiraceae bacterium]|nr:hypothetical protein [Oscillospiraceae bacterium]